MEQFFVRNYFIAEHRVACVPAYEVKKKTPFLSMGAGKSLPLSDNKTGEIVANRLTDCWHFHPTLSISPWPAVKTGPGPAEQGGLNVTAPSSPQR